LPGKGGEGKDCEFDQHHPSGKEKKKGLFPKLSSQKEINVERGEGEGDWFQRGKEKSKVRNPINNGVCS